MACDENDSGGLWWTGGWSDLSIWVPSTIQFCSYASTNHTVVLWTTLATYPSHKSMHVYEKVTCVCMFCQKKRPILKFFTVGR
jgi:hypothetical protein